jgi:hypothetical protein
LLSCAERRVGSALGSRKIGHSTPLLQGSLILAPPMA